MARTVINEAYDYQKALEKVHKNFSKRFADIGYGSLHNEPIDGPMAKTVKGERFWKFIPCSYDASYLSELEKQLHIKLPLPYKEFLLSCHHMVGYFIGNNCFSDPANMHNYRCYKALATVGYIPLGTDPDDQIIYCLKRSKDKRTGEYCVYMLDLNVYYTACEASDSDDFWDYMTPSQYLQSSMCKVASSLRAFLEMLADNAQLNELLGLDEDEGDD